MEFLLIFDWVDEDTFEPIAQRIESYGTKEELLEAKKEAEKKYSYQVEIGRLILSPAIGYSWADIDRLF